MHDSQIMYRHLQVAILIYIFLEVEKQNKYIYKGSSNKSMFFYKTFCKIHTTYIPVISSRMHYWNTSLQ